MHNVFVIVARCLPLGIVRIAAATKSQPGHDRIVVVARSRSGYGRIATAAGSRSERDRITVGSQLKRNRIVVEFKSNHSRNIVTVPWLNPSRIVAATSWPITATITVRGMAQVTRLNVMRWGALQEGWCGWIGGGSNSRAPTHKIRRAR